MACHAVDLRSACAVGEHAFRQGYVAFQHKGVNFPLLLGGSAEGYGARYVGRAVAVLRPGVYQNETAPFKLHIRSLVGLVMHYRAVCAIGGYGGEAQSPVKFLPRPQRGEQPVHAHFGYSFFHFLVQAAEERNHRHAVAQHGTVEAVDLRPVLYGLQFAGCRGGGNASAVSVERQHGAVSLVGNHCAAGAELLDGFAHAFVRPRLHALRSKVTFHLGGKLFGTDKKHRPFVGEQKI